MHILFPSPELLTVGGIQRYDRLMVVALDRYVSNVGGHLSVLCLNDMPPSDLPSELAGLKATALSFYSGQRVPFIRSFGARVRAATVVIYGLLGFSPLALIQKLLNPRAHSLLTLYGLDAWDYRSRLHAWGIHKITSFASISQYTLDRFRQAYQVPSARPGFVIPNPVSSDFISSAEKAQLELEAGSPHLLSVARLASTEKYKGIDCVLQALPDLLRHFPDLVYTVIGDGSDRPRLEALAGKLGVQRSARFLGFVPEEILRREFARCTLYVMPSEKEGFGFVFIEAMAHGKPVVAARAGATPEVVEHGETGLLVEYGNVPQLVEAISTLSHDPSLRHRMGQAGQGTVRAKYGFDAFSDRWSQAIDALIGR